MFLALDKYLWFKKTKELIATGTILDLGGGEGLFESLFPEKTSQATILEVSANHRPGTIPFVVYGGRTFPFKNKSFDIGIALQTLEHIPPRIRKLLMAEFRRVIRTQIILAFPTRRLHFERIFMAVFILYSIIGMPNMRKFYDEHLQHGLPKTKAVIEYFDRPPKYSRQYFGKLSCLVLLVQLIFPIFIPLSAFLETVIRKLEDPDPIFALLCWNQLSLRE